MIKFIYSLRRVWSNRKAKLSEIRQTPTPAADLALLPPPAVWSRVLIWTLGTGSLSLLLWSVFAKVEETVVLTGEISTTQPGVQVSAADPGVITAVMVKPFQPVTAGQVLFTYEDDETAGRLESQLRKQELLERQRKTEQSLYILRMQQVEEQIRLDRDLLTRLSRLLSAGAIQETQVLEKRTQVAKGVLSLNSLKEEMIRAEHQSEQAQEEVRQVIAELRSKTKRFVIKSPVNGFVQELKYQSAGERIQPSDQVALVVPGQQLHARVRVPSRLSAPLVPQTAAVVDIDAYPAADYGSVNASVNSISPTTTQDSSQSTEKSYSADLKLLSTSNPKRLQLAQLRPGMAVTAKVRLREKPVIATVFDFLTDLFDPLTEQR